MQKQLFSGSFTDIFEACKTALHKMEASIQYASKSKGTIVANTGFSILSWGEEIQIFITQKNGSHIEVEVRSNTDKQLIDWGKSEKNEREFLQQLRRIRH